MKLFENRYDYSGDRRPGPGERNWEPRPCVFFMGIMDTAWAWASECLLTVALGVVIGMAVHRAWELLVM